MTARATLRYINTVTPQQGSDSAKESDLSSNPRISQRIASSYLNRRGDRALLRGGIDAPGPGGVDNGEPLKGQTVV